MEYIWQHLHHQSGIDTVIKINYKKLIGKTSRPKSGFSQFGEFLGIPDWDQFVDKEKGVFVHGCICLAFFTLDFEGNQRGDLRNLVGFARCRRCD